MSNLQPVVRRWWGAAAPLIACVLIAACGPSSCGRGQEVGGPTGPRRFGGVTTDGTAALHRLEGDIGRLERLSATGKPSVRDRAVLAEWTGLRGRYTGRVDDAARSLELSEQLVRDFPDNRRALLARARAHANLHQFPEAQTDIERARQLGATGQSLESLQASIFEAQGRYDEALKIRLAQCDGRRNVITLGALASLRALRGETKEAEDGFTEALLSYRDRSPFPVSALLVDEAEMSMRQQQYARARDLFDEAQQRLPGYVAARGGLARAEAALGNRDRAIALLRTLVLTADDPEYAALLAGVLAEAGQTGDAERWRQRAAERYDRVLARYPAAFSETAGVFWLGPGGDPKKALALAQRNFEIHQTPAAQALVVRAALAANDSATACAAARSAPAALQLIPDHDRVCAQ